MTEHERLCELARKVRNNPSENTRAFMRDHLPDEPERIEELIAVAMMIEDGKLFYNEKNKHLIKMHQRMH